MFFGKNQTGYMTQQQPAVNMVNQPDMMNAVPTEGMPYQGAPENVQQEGMYPTHAQAQMGGMYQTQDLMGGMHHTQHHMGYVCDPCYCVPCEPTETEPQPQPQIYVVQKGDTVYKIAQKFGLDWRELAGYNHLGNPDLIYPGERLFIPPRY